MRGMQNKIIIFIILTTIAALIVLIAGLFLTSVIRRVHNKRKYRKLDYLRCLFDKKIRESLQSRTMMKTQHEFIAPPKSLAWQAIEDVLLNIIDEKKYQEEVIRQLSALGYITFYEKQLEHNNIQVRALSIDKLGRMKSRASVLKLTLLLDEKNPEIVSIVVRSLSRIGGRAALQSLVHRLPVLLEKSIVTRKAIGMAVQSFGEEAIPFLVRQKEGTDYLWFMSCILDMLSRLPADLRSGQFAIHYLSSTHPEVRSKALKAVGRVEYALEMHRLSELLLPLLRDPVWFVRLQAIRSLTALGNEGTIDRIGELITDENWQVRNEAVQACTVLGRRSLDIFLKVLSGADRYAKESICEELEKTNFTIQLIKNLQADDHKSREKSRRILELMHALGFSTPLDQYLMQQNDETGKELIRGIMEAGSRA